MPTATFLAWAVWQSPLPASKGLRAGRSEEGSKGSAGGSTAGGRGFCPCPSKLEVASLKGRGPCFRSDGVCLKIVGAESVETPCMRLLGTPFGIYSHLKCMLLCLSHRRRYIAIFDQVHPSSAYAFLAASMSRQISQDVCLPGQRGMDATQIFAKSLHQRATLPSRDQIGLQKCALPLQQKQFPASKSTLFGPRISC